MIKRKVIGILVCLLLFSNLTFAELNLKPKYYKEGETITEEIMGLSVEDWMKVVEKIKDLREINKLREEQIENSKIIHKQYEDLLENSQRKIDLYKENIDLFRQERDLYKDETEKYQEKYLNIIKWNSYRTGFTFVLGISTAIFAGWIFNEATK